MKNFWRLDEFKLTIYRFKNVIIEINTEKVMIKVTRVKSEEIAKELKKQEEKAKE